MNKIIHHITIEEKLVKLGDDINPKSILGHYNNKKVYYVAIHFKGFTEYAFYMTSRPYKQWLNTGTVIYDMESDTATSETKNHITLNSDDIIDFD